jgi:hypothetical protein
MIHRLMKVIARARQRWHMLWGHEPFDGPYDDVDWIGCKCGVCFYQFERDFSQED